MEPDICPVKKVNGMVIIKRIHGITIGLLVALFVIIPGIMSASSDGDQNPQTMIINALQKSDLVSSTSDSEGKFSLIRQARDELVQAKDLLNQNSDANISVLNNYVDYWVQFEDAYGAMITGSEQKLKAYESLTGNNSDKYQNAFDTFTEAEKTYTTSKGLFEQTLPVIKSLDPTISDLLPDAAIPKESVTQEIIARLTDNIQICNGYKHLCKAQVLKISAGNTITLEVESELYEGNGIMQSLIFSAYVGDEATRFANTTLSAGSS